MHDYQDPLEWPVPGRSFYLATRCCASGNHWRCPLISITSFVAVDLSSSLFRLGTRGLFAAFLNPGINIRFLEAPDVAQLEAGNGALVSPDVDGAVCDLQILGYISEGHERVGLRAGFLLCHGFNSG